MPITKEEVRQSFSTSLYEARRSASMSKTEMSRLGRAIDNIVKIGEILGDDSARDVMFTLSNVSRRDLGTATHVSSALLSAAQATRDRVYVSRVFTRLVVYDSLHPDMGYEAAEFVISEFSKPVKHTPDQVLSMLLNPEFEQFIDSKIKGFRYARGREKSFRALYREN